MIVFITALILRIIIGSASSSLQRAPNLLVISFDGFRPDYVDAASTPNLYKISIEGVVGKRMRPVFGTKTYPNHMSIATGLYEEEHGIVHNAMYDPQFNDTFEESNNEERWWDNGKSNPIWTANQAENDNLIRESGVIMWPGSHVKFHNGKIIPKFVKPYTSYPNMTDVAETIVEWFTADANCIFTYVNQPDKTSHLYGPFSKEVREVVKSLDSFIGYLFKRLREADVLHQINIMILSDHGMAEVTYDRVIEMNSFLNRSTYEFYGRSPLWTIRPNPGQLSYVYDTLLKESKKTGNFKVYRKQDVPVEYRFKNNRRILDLVVVAEDGYDIVDERSNLVRSMGNVWGNHGYNNSADSMRPLFLAEGPAFYTPFRIENEFLNIDLYPLMCMILHLFPLERFPSSGSLKSLHKILKPIVRDAPAENVLSVLSTMLIGSALFLTGAGCFVFCSSFGKTKKRVELTWDPGTSDFDLGQDNFSLQGIARKKFKVSPPASESALLLDCEDFEEQ